MSKIYGNTVGGGGSQVSSEQIPTKISELENDVGFITLSAIPDGIDGLSMWTATIEYQGETCTTLKAQIPSTIDREIQVDDLILYTNGIVGRVTQVATSSVAVVDTGIDLSGKAGYSPVKGTDYWTEEDKTEIEADNITYISTELAKRGQLKPEFANSIEECTDTTKLYVLPDGYIYAYMMAEVEEGGYTNLLPNAVSGADGIIFNGTGYKDGARLNSSGVESTLGGAFLTGFIPVRVGETLYLNGNYIKTDWASAGSANARFYNSNFENIDTASTPMGSYVSGAAFIDVVTNDEGYVTQFKMNPNWAYYSNWGDLTYIRMTLIGSGAGCIIAHEPIVEPTVKKEYAWANTGLPFVPADYEDRIVGIEGDIEELNKRIENIGDADSSLPTYWTNEIKTVTSKIRAKQNISGIDAVSFVLTTDIHASDSISAKGERFGKVAKSIMDEANIPLFVAMGDLASQSPHTEITNAYNELDLAKKWLSVIPDYKQAVIMGNHDGAWGSDYKKQFSPKEMFNLLYRHQVMDSRRVFGEDGTYYYLDSVAQKMRFIFLNAQYAPNGDIDETTGNALYDRFNHSCLGETQLKWLANTALILPENYTACVFLHNPYINDLVQLVGIIQEFNAKGSIINTYTDANNAWTNSAIDFDFSGRNGEVIAVFAGHMHQELIRTPSNSPVGVTAENGKGYVLPCPMILSTTSLGGKIRDTSEPEREEGTATEFVMEIVTIDKSNKMIYLTKLGAGSDREVVYKEV